jgi:hypothetical protein
LRWAARAAAGAAFCVAGFAPAGAGEWSLAGSAHGELRVFPFSPAEPVQLVLPVTRQEDTVVSASIAAEPEIAYSWNEGDDRIEFIPFGRFDSEDERRTHWDIREANWLHVESGYDFVLGVDRVFWGVTESRHLVDIVNQRDLVEDVDEEDVLGQPMANLNVITDYGVLSGFVLPYFRERTFPGGDERLRGVLPVETDEARYEEGVDRWHVDFALRYENTFGPLDIGLAHFHGISREPRLVPALANGTQPVLLPFYDVIDQTSLDAQLTFGPTLLKLEAITRTGHPDETINALVAGVEYTFFGLVGESGDLGLLAEYLYDDRDERATEAPPTAFGNDVFVGARLNLNDEDNTYLLAGAIIDVENQSTFLSLEASRRLADQWTLELDLRFFFPTEDEDPLNAIGRDDFVQVRLAYFF